MSVAIDELWLDGAHGVGSLLMTDPDLPRDRFGHPYQALFWFDEASNALALVVDPDGRVMAWDRDASEPTEPTAEGEDDWLCAPAPDEVAAAAREWFARQPDGG